VALPKDLLDEATTEAPAASVDGTASDEAAP